MKFGILPKDQIQEFYPQIQSLVESAYFYGDAYRDEDELMDDIEAGKAFLWVYLENGDPVGICVTDIHEVGDIRRAMIHTTATQDNIDWARAHAEIEDWAKHNGCQQIMIIGRPGWQRKLREVGYKSIEVTLLKEI